MSDTPPAETSALQAQIAELLADALRSDENHDSAMVEAHRVHETETAAAQHAHDDELHAANAAHEREVVGLHHALDSRNVIGQAQGIIMAALHCPSDEAFGLLVKQSQAENRKLVDIAADIAASTQRRPRPDGT